MTVICKKHGIKQQFPDDTTATKSLTRPRNVDTLVDGNAVYPTITRQRCLSLLSNTFLFVRKTGPETEASSILFLLIIKEERSLENRSNK